MTSESRLYRHAIVALICSAAALMAAILFVRPSPAPAEETVVGRDYSAVTALSINQSEALYIVDNRTGVVGVFLYEPARGLVFKGSAPLARAFGAGAAPAR